MEGEDSLSETSKEQKRKKMKKRFKSIGALIAKGMNARKRLKLGSK